MNVQLCTKIQRNIERLEHNIISKINVISNKHLLEVLLNNLNVSFEIHIIKYLLIILKGIL